MTHINNCMNSCNIKMMTIYSLQLHFLQQSKTATPKITMPLCSPSTSLVVLRCPWCYNWKLRHIKWPSKHQLNVLREDDNRMHLGKAAVWSIGKPSMSNIDSGQLKYQSLRTAQIYAQPRTSQTVLSQLGMTI